MADRMREFGHETLAILPADNGIADWYDERNIETKFAWSEPLRRRRSLLGHVWFLIASIIATVKLAFYIRKERIDLVHINEIRYPYAVVAAKMGGAKVVCHVRANYESKVVRRLLSTLTVYFADRVVCVSKRTEEIMFKNMPLSSENVVVLHDGLPSPERLNDVPDEPMFREELDVSDDQMLVLNVSKFVESKGQDRVIDAAAHLAESQNDIQFALVGGFVEGHQSYAEDIQERTDSMDNVHVVGFYEDVMAAIAASDVLVHVPRNEDPFPNVVLEGMMSGKPVVGSRSGGIPEQITDGETGFLVPKRDSVKEIANTLLQLYQKPSIRRQIGAKAKEFAFKELDPETYYKELNELYTN